MPPVAFLNCKQKSKGIFLMGFLLLNLLQLFLGAELNSFHVSVRTNGHLFYSFLRGRNEKNHLVAVALLLSFGHTTHMSVVDAQ